MFDAFDMKLKLEKKSELMDKQIEFLNSKYELLTKGNQLLQRANMVLEEKERLGYIHRIPDKEQPVQPKKKLEAFSNHEITETKFHEMDICPFCGEKPEKNGEEIVRDKLDYDMVVMKVRHRFVVYNCDSCKHRFHLPIPPELKDNNQYGSRVNGLILALSNIGNIPVEKIRKMVYGLSGEEINLREGYIINRQKANAMDLLSFQEDLRQRCLKLKTLYWYDIPVDVDTRRGWLRFYGDETMAFYDIHFLKNREDITHDKFLKLLPKETVVIHDRDGINYNKEYRFNNRYENIKLMEDLKRITDILHRSWSHNLKDHLEKTDAERKEAMARGEEAFDDGHVKAFFDKFEQIIMEGTSINIKDYHKYFGKDERSLLLRIYNHKDNYLSWVVNFHLPFLNEESKGPVKFQSEEAAANYGIIKGYIETCYRNGINVMVALKDLSKGKPYTLEEILLK